jgi:hypothetical protein
MSEAQYTTSLEHALFGQAALSNHPVIACLQ